jgi:hypothetical protein
MPSTGQRQDLTFLWLAAVVLVVAVALFVGMKSIPKKPVESDSDEGAVDQGLDGAAEGDQVPDVSGGRDPFRSPTGAGGAVAGREPQGDLKLVGIVTGAGEGPRAVIHSGRRRHFAGIGDHVGGYVVTSIGTNTAVLERDGDRLTLVLREPELEQ